MSKVFISYRRDDAADAAHRLYDHLLGEFGSENVFIDIDSMPPGVDFRRHLNDSIDQCDVVLAVIGEHWLDNSDVGNSEARRIDDENDFVRLEIERSLQRNIWVIPVLVGHARMPTPRDLPKSLENLSYRNAIELRSHTGEFRIKVERLIRDLKKYRAANVKTASKSTTATTAKEERSPAVYQNKDPIDAEVIQESPIPGGESAAPRIPQPATNHPNAGAEDQSSIPTTSPGSETYTLVGRRMRQERPMRLKRSIFNRRIVGWSSSVVGALILLLLAMSCVYAGIDRTGPFWESDELQTAELIIGFGCTAIIFVAPFVGLSLWAFLSIATLTTELKRIDQQ